MHSFLWLSGTPLYIYTTASLSSHLLMDIPDAFLSMAEWYSTVYIYHSFFIQSSVDGHLGCFHVLAIINSASVNTEIHVSFSVLISSGHMPRSGVVGSHGGLIPSFLSSRHTVFHSGCIITFPPTVQEHSLFSTPSPAFIVCRLFDDGHSDWVRWYLIIVLICTSLIMNDVEHLFMCLFSSVQSLSHV